MKWKIEWFLFYTDREVKWEACISIKSGYRWVFPILIFPMEEKLWFLDVSNQNDFNWLPQICQFGINCEKTWRTIKQSPSFRMNTIKQESHWNVIKGNNIFIYITCYTYKTFKTTTRNSILGGDKNHK